MGFDLSAIQSCLIYLLVIWLFISSPVLTSPAVRAAGPGNAGGCGGGGVEEEEDEGVDGRVGHHGHPNYCLHHPTPGHGAPGVSQDLLPDELIHHVGQVGDHKDGDHCQGEVGDLLLGSGEVVTISSLGQVDSHGCSRGVVMEAGGLKNRMCWSS